MSRPDRDLVARWVFDEQGEPRREAKRRAERLSCTRRGHTLALAIRTPDGWWVAWRPNDERRWEYDWSDQVTGYTEATCACDRARRVDPWFATLAP